MPTLNLADTDATKSTSANWAYPVGFWTGLILTLGGIIYFCVVVAAILLGQFTLPPADWVQLFGGVDILIVCPLLVVLMACLHTVTPPSKKAFSQAGLGFTLLFALAVSINRFTQLGVVSQSQAAGLTDGIDWFLAYGSHSVMFGLEMMGWGWFLGLAMLAAAPVFSGGRLQVWLRGLMILYGVLGLVSAVAFLAGSPLAAIGFVAWGLVLFIITALLAVYFREGKRR